MTTHKPFKASALLICLTLLLVLFSGCAENMSTNNSGKINSSTVSDKVSPGWYSEKHNVLRPFSYDEYCALKEKYEETGQRDKELQTFNEYIPGTLESFIEGASPDRYTSLVARGKVIGFDYRVIREYPRGDADSTEYIVTDYYVDLIEVLRGEAETDDKGLIKVRTFGGETDTAAMVNLDFNFAVGNEYLFVLKLPYAPCGAATGESGCYNINLIYCPSENTSDGEDYAAAGNQPNTNEPKFFVPYIARDEAPTVSLSEFREYMIKVNEIYPVPTSEELRAAAINRMEEYLKNGGISQEDFDIYMERLDKFAEIVE